MRMITDAGMAAGGTELTDEGVLLDHLAEVQVSCNRTLDAAAGPLRGAEGLGTLIAVVGILDPEQATLLASTWRPARSRSRSWSTRTAGWGSRHGRSPSRTRRTTPRSRC